MKLNLVPTNVSKERASGGAVVTMFLLIIAGIVVCALMIVTSSNKLATAKSDEADSLAKAANVKAISDQADALMASREVNTLVRDVNLAKAMTDHNAVYPNLYDRVRSYIPSYYRVTSMAASPGDADQCVVTLSGTLTTYQQYADLGLAFMRMPGAISYSPSGYQITDKFVPALTPEDMRGRPIRPGEASIPDDPLQRMDYYMRDGHLTGYLAQNNFGNADGTLKGAMPNESQVTISIVLHSDPKWSANIQTPDPRATLAAAASAASTSTAPASGAAGGFGGPPATSTTPPATTPPPAEKTTTKKGKGKASGDDE